MSINLAIGSRLPAHAAINVSDHAARVSLEQLEADDLPVLLAASRGISKALGVKSRGRR
jgi:hypothetical protein